MPIGPGAFGYITSEQLTERAQQFLREHDAEGVLPVPIESIIEIDMHIDITPIPGLSQIGGVCEVGAYLANSGQEICIDELYMDDEHRYRFALAHELAHVLLHRSIFGDRPVNSISEWKKFRISIPDRAYGSAEYQANELAGQILVPYVELQKQVSAVVTSRMSDVELTDAMREDSRYFIAEELVDVFNVSRQSLQIRLDRHKLP